MATNTQTIEAAIQPQTLPSLEIPSRSIPVPDTVSPELQQVLAMPALSIELPYPATNDEWDHLIGDPAELAKIARALAEKHQITIRSATTDSGVKCFTLTPAEIPPHNRDRLLVNVHGGGYTLGAGEGGTTEAILMAAAGRIKVVAIDYRMPPNFPFPAAIDDCMDVWKHLLKGHDPKTMALFGTSTGGALVLSMVQRAKEEGLPLPAAVASGTPWSDLSKSGDSYFINDLGTHTYEGILQFMAEVYTNGVDLKDPRVSPVYGDFTDFPPTVLVSGTRDLFLSNTVRVDEKLRKAGVETRLHLYEGHAHATYLNAMIEKDSAWAFAQMYDFLDSHLK